MSVFSKVRRRGEKSQLSLVSVATAGDCKGGVAGLWGPLWATVGTLDFTLRAMGTIGGFRLRGPETLAWAAWGWEWVRRTLQATRGLPAQASDGRVWHDFL